MTETIFEDTILPIPGNYNEYLIKNYGINYMKYPDKNKRFAKHTLDINLNSCNPTKKVLKDKNIMRIIFLGMVLSIISLFTEKFLILGMGLSLILLGIILYQKNK